MNMSLSLARLVLTRPLFATVIFLTTTGGALHQLTNDQNTSGARNNLSEPVNKPPTGQKAGPWGPLEAPVMEMLMRMGNEDPNQEHVKSMLNEPEPEEGESDTPGKSIADLLAQSGFQYELHNCTSPDGYITQLVRMVNPKINPNELREIPVVFYTGQGMSPAVFLVTGAPSTRRPTDWRPQANSDEDLFGEIREQVGPANRSLAVMLSNNGFDVWLVPTRGIDAQNRARQHLLTGAEASKTKSTTSKSNSANSIISTKANDTKKEDDNDNDGIPAMPDLLAEMFTKKLETGSDGGPGNSSTTARGLKSGESDLFEKLRRLVKKLAAKNYWSFSSDEIIEKELECQLELVRSVSKAPKVSVISYSNGGFIMFGFLSRRPEYAHDYLDAIINLAPAVFVNKLNLILGMASVISKLNPPDWPFLEDHIDELARTSIIKLCKCKAIRYSACKLLLNQLYGPSDMFKAQLDMALFDYIGRPVSANSLRQLLQVAYAGEMRQYDHGLLGNLIFYGKSVPSSYDLRAVNHNHLYVVSGSQDAIADSKSLTQLMGSIGCKPQSWLHIPTYNHLDLLVAHDNAKQVNLPVLKILVDRDFEVDYYRRNSNEDDDGNSTSENDQDEDEDEGDQEDFNVRYEKDKQDEANRHEAEADEEVETNSETPSHEYDGPDFYEEPKVEKLEQNEPKDHHHHHHNESLHNNEHEPHHKEHPQHHHPEQHHDDNHQKQQQQPKQEPEHETKPHAQHEHHEHHEHHDNKDLDQPKKKPEPELEREQQAPKNNEQATHLEKHPNHPEHDQHQHKHNKPGHEEGPHTLPHDHKHPDKDHRQPKKEPKAPPPPKEPHQHEPKHEPGHEPGPPHVQHDPTKHQISDQKQPKQEPKASQDQQDLQQQQDKQVQPKPSDQRQSKPEPQVNQGQDQNEDQKQQQQQPQQEKQQEPQEKGQQQPKLDQQDQERQDQPKQAPQAAGQGEARPGQQEEDEIVPSYNSQRRPPKEEPQVQDQEQDGQGQGEGEEESGRKQVAPEQPQEEQPQEQPPQQEKYPARYQVLEQKNFDNIDQEQVDQSAISVAVLDEPSNTINAQSESNNTKTNLPPANTIAALDTTTIKPVTLPTGVRTSKGKPRRATQKRRSAPGLANLLATSRTKQAQASQRSSRIEKCRQ